MRDRPAAAPGRIGGVRSLWSGAAVSTGTNWIRAPHIARLSQPMRDQVDERERVRGEQRRRPGKPNPHAIRTSPASSETSAAAKYDIVQRESFAPVIVDLRAT